MSMTTLRPMTSRGGAERAAPESVADHHRVGEPGHGVRGSVHASELRARAEQLKIVGARDEHLDAFRPSCRRGTTR